jgi:hypothetical protein
MKFIIIIGLLSSLIGCASTPGKLTKDGARIKLVQHKPTKCQLIDQVEGRSDIGSPELAINHAKNLAAELGANQIYVKEEISNGKIRRAISLAYICK